MCEYVCTVTGFNINNNAYIDICESGHLCVLFDQLASVVCYFRYRRSQVHQDGIR